jgi:hypothetical protein
MDTNLLASLSEPVSFPFTILFSASVLEIVGPGQHKSPCELCFHFDPTEGIKWLTLHDKKSAERISVESWRFTQQG